MNRGDFGAVYLPKRFTIVTAGTYRVANRSGFPLGAISSATVGALKFTIPKAVLDQLTADGLVTATTIDLYGDADADKPTASAQNMTRYLSLLQQILPVQVED